MSIGHGLCLPQLKHWSVEYEYWSWVVSTSTQTLVSRIWLLVMGCVYLYSNIGQKNICQWLSCLPLLNPCQGEHLSTVVLSTTTATLVERIYAKGHPIYLYYNTGQENICRWLFCLCTFTPMLVRRIFLRAVLVVFTSTPSMVRRIFVNGCPSYL
jgi:hypothetical protein